MTLRELIKELQTLEARHGGQIATGLQVHSGGGHGDPGYSTIVPIIGAAQQNVARWGPEGFHEDRWIVLVK